MASKIKFYVTNTQKLPELPVSDGNVIYTVDFPRMYLDYGGQRLQYSVIEVDDDASRLALTSPQSGYYYVVDTNVFWRCHNGTWKQLTPSNVEPIYFSDSSTEFPTEGKVDALYTTYDSLYRWNDKEKDYVIVANKTAWQAMA